MTMIQLAIKGHPTRSKEIIEILEMLGGKNTHDYICNMPDFAYSINEQGIIEWFMAHLNSSITIFTLEEFLEKFPYKVGDKVKTIYGKIGTVSKPIWSNRDNCIRYELEADTDSFYFINELQLHKEETMEKVKDNWAKWDLPDGYEFQDKDGNIINTSVIRLVKKQPEYPKTYEECCKVLNLTKYPPALVPNKVGFITQYEDFPYYYEIQKLAELLVCRNAYWKIAGEQMGLGKPWEPDYTDDNVKYIIGIHRNHLDLNLTIERNYILIFPTEEIRDTFYENFKSSIEDCKELL